MTQDTTIKEDLGSPATNLDARIESINLANDLDDDVLINIGNECSKGYELDKDSRHDWEQDIEDWMDIVNQVRQEKTFPWPGASNVKYPLVLTASMQFNARAYPQLVPNDGKIVKAQVIGVDPSGEKNIRANKVARILSYQMMSKIPSWEEDMDHLLLILGIVGTCFRKTYFDPYENCPVSKLVFAENLVVDYYARSLDTAERVSEIIKLSDRELQNRIRSKIYSDVELGEPPSENGGDPYWTLIEQHTWYDLDKDGYEEPYVITFEYGSKKVLRIVARYASNGIYKQQDKIVKITPIQYYTKYGFIKNPNGSFYDLGFSQLLGPINEATNSILNQLIDAGTLNNLQSGFLGKGLRIKMGDSAFRPGEWKTINSTVDDLKRQIMPLPTKEPSSVLFQLLGTLIQSGKELASVAEIFTGKMPGQNTPATTTMATIEQGMKLFTAIYKRVYRSLAEEMLKLYRLDFLYFEKMDFMSILDEDIGAKDFDSSDYDILPSADPSVSSQTERLLKAQGLMELLPVFGPMNMMNPQEVLIRILEAQEQPNWQKLVPGMVETGQPSPPPPQQPDPKMMEMQMKQDLANQSAQQKNQELERKAAIEQQSQEAKLAGESQARAQEFEHRARMNELEANQRLHMQNIFIREAAIKSHAKEQQSLQQQKNSKSGKNTQ